MQQVPNIRKPSAAWPNSSASPRLCCESTSNKDWSSQSAIRLGVGYIYRTMSSESGNTARDSEASRQTHESDQRLLCSTFASGLRLALPQPVHRPKYANSLMPWPNFLPRTYCAPRSVLGYACNIAQLRGSVSSAEPETQKSPKSR